MVLIIMSSEVVSRQLRHSAERSCSFERLPHSPVQPIRRDRRLPVNRPHLPDRQDCSTMKSVVRGIERAFEIRAEPASSRLMSYLASW
jgi:hypothetical protein